MNSPCRRLVVNRHTATALLGVAVLLLATGCVDCTAENDRRH
ncbi:hypothetical protein [Micromonospora sp. LOL_024]